MRILLLSDLHVEFEAFEPPPAAADVVVLAGDVHVGAAGLTWAQTHFKDVPVLYVLGNHEYYGQQFHRLALELRDRAAGSNVAVLERERACIDGVHFLGCTLWTDFALWGDAASGMKLASERMSDFERIQGGLDGRRRLLPEDVRGSHQRSRRWLDSEFARLRGERVVVITHHAPSLRSIPARERHEDICCAYASPLDAVVRGSGAALWLHGHVHESVDYRIGNTRVVANARGYPAHISRHNDNFAAGLVLEV